MEAQIGALAAAAEIEQRAVEQQQQQQQQAVPTTTQPHLRLLQPEVQSITQVCEYLANTNTTEKMKYLARLVEWDNKRGGRDMVRTGNFFTKFSIFFHVIDDDEVTALME